MVEHRGEYVDIHGAELNVLSKDGKIYIPYHEIRKTGFHIFPKSDFNKSKVGKSMILNELSLYLLGAAREFLIQKEVGFVNHGDVGKLIEECRDKLTENGLPNTNISQTSTGVLGRTLLQNPAELRGGSKPLPQANQPQYGVTQANQTQYVSSKSDVYGSSNSLNRRSLPKTNDTGTSLRMPHQNDKQTDLNFDDSPKNNQFNQRKRNSNNADQNRNGRNNRGTNSDSRSTSDNEDRNSYVMLSQLNLQRIELQPEPQEVKVVHVEKNNDKFKYWVQFTENEQIVMDIMEKSMLVAEDCEIATPKCNEIYLVQHKEDELWYRVIVMRDRPKLKVHFIDFGNDAIVTELRTIPEDLKAIPGQACRLTVSKPEGASPVLLEMDEVLTVRKIKQFDDKTYVVQKCNKKTNVSPPQKMQQEPVLVNEVNYSKNLLNGEGVKIVAYSEGMLYLRTREHHSKLAEIEKEIMNCTRKPVAHVVPNQLVLCENPDYIKDKLCRAIVKKIENNTVSVHFMDFHKDAKVPLSNIFAANRTLSNVQTLLVATPLKGFGTNELSVNAADVLENHIMAKTKFTVEKCGTEYELLNGNKGLSEILFPFNPNVVPPTSTVNHAAKPAAYEKVMYEDMKCYEPAKGAGDYMLTNYKDPTEFTVTPTTVRESELLAKCTGIAVEDERPYEPEETEMVLGRYLDDWYRALVIDKNNDGSYQVLFVEYGNMAMLMKEDIRRFPDEFKDIPILGLFCQFQVDNTEAVKKRLEQLMVEDNIYEIDFIQFDVNTLQHTVDIPHIRAKLQQEGLTK